MNIIARCGRATRRVWDERQGQGSNIYRVISIYRLRKGGIDEHVGTH
jgi:hypothetical protein